LLGERGFCLTTFQCAIGYLLEFQLEDNEEEDELSETESIDSSDRRKSSISLTKDLPPNLTEKEKEKLLKEKAKSDAEKAKLIEKIQREQKKKEKEAAAKAAKEKAKREKAEKPKGAGDKKDLSQFEARRAVQDLDQVVGHALLVLFEALQAHKEDAWAFYYNNDNISVYRKWQPGSSIQMVKGVGIIRATPQQILPWLIKPEKRREYDELCDSLQYVAKIDDTSHVAHLKWGTRRYVQEKQSKKDFVALNHWRTLADDRDFVYAVHWRTMPDGTSVVVEESVNHPLCPENPQCTRGHVYISGWVIRPAKAEDDSALGGSGKPSTASSSAAPTTEVIHVVHTDLRGHVPSWLKNLLVSKQPLMIAKVRQKIEGASNEKL